MKDFSPKTKDCLSKYLNTATTPLGCADILQPQKRATTNLTE